MKQRKSAEWTRLDNASKVFPATCNDKDTKVFRFACELYEAVKPEILQQALDITIDSFPLYKSVLRKGIFWYYLEASDIPAVVEIESYPVCAPIYIKDRKNLLFRVFYYNNRINVEMFHALTDGTGALWFIQTLVYNYLDLNYNKIYKGEKPDLDYNASISQKMDDSFKRYFAGKGIFKLTAEDQKRKPNTRVYHIKGSRLDENRMNLIEGSMSAKSVLCEAHKYNATLTVFIASAFIYSIYKGMPVWDKNRFVVLSVPINLRQFYESETARNFFSTMKVGYCFKNGDTDFSEVVASVSESFKRELEEGRLKEQCDKFMSIEKNPFARVVPLPFKDYSLKIASKIEDRGITAAVSNIGRIVMPEGFDKYIRQFSVLTSARRPQICLCTYGDRLVVSFTSPFKETDIQRTFFQFLSRRGIEIEVSSNL